MTGQIKKVAVIGAGTMGGGIAAHCANAGMQVVLLDMAPTELMPEEQAKGLTLDSKAVRNRVVNTLFDRVKKSRPAALFTPERAGQITIGNLTDDLNLIADADWIVEVIVEQLEPKRALMERIEQVRKPGSIVSSNTSGIPIAAIAAGRSDAFKQHFLGTHFFNPPRYLYLLEVIPTADTLPEVVGTIWEFADHQLGKGVVLAKDRPNFIGNRIFSYTTQARILYALERGYSVEEVDSLTGELIGNPKTATFRLLDLVGLDVGNHVTANLYDAVPDDEERAIFRIPEPLKAMAAQGWLGNKAGVGFYKQEKGAAGKEFWPLNIQTMQHEAPKKPRFELVGKARKIEDLRERLRFILDNADMDRAGQFLRDTTLRTLAYTARRIPEISDRIADLDNAMRWGFSQQLGPFETWDALGVRTTVGRMKERDIAVVVVADLVDDDLHLLGEARIGVLVVHPARAGLGDRVEQRACRMLALREERLVAERDAQHRHLQARQQRVRARFAAHALGDVVEQHADEVDGVRILLREHGRPPLRADLLQRHQHVLPKRRRVARLAGARLRDVGLLLQRAEHALQIVAAHHVAVLDERHARSLRVTAAREQHAERRKELCVLLIGCRRRDGFRRFGRGLRR